MEKEGFFALKRYFGDAIIPKGKGVARIRKKKNAWERTLKIPF